MVIGAAVFLAVGIPFCVRQIPWSFEQKLADRLGAPSWIKSCLLPDSDAQKILDQVVHRIYPIYEDEKNLPPISVQIVADKQVNAFAVLGRKIFVFQGLLDKAQTPEELEGVLAHEIEHIRHRHVLEVAVNQLILNGSFWIFVGESDVSTKTLNSLFDLKFSRQKEKQADEDGLKRLQIAKVNPQGIRDFFTRLQKNFEVPAILSDHPSFEDRLASIPQPGSYETLPVLEPTDWQKLKTACPTN
jgi:predicted Zn-dependent protease